MTSHDERLDAAVQRLGQAEVSDEALARLASAARAELAATPRAAPWWRDALLLLGLNLVMAVGASAAMTWSTVQHASALTRSLVAGGWLVVLALGSVLWLRPGRGAARWVVGGLFGAVSLFTVLGASGWDPGGPFLGGLSCAFVECGVALVPLGVTLALSTRFAASPGHVFLGGLTSATAGAFALHLHCPNGTVAHVVGMHLAPALLLGAVAVLVHRLVRARAFVP